MISEVKVVAQFSKNWAKDESRGFSERLKEAVKPEESLKPRLDQASRLIQAQITNLDNRLLRLHERDSYIFKRMVVAMQKHDTQTSSALSNELAEVRKMAKIVSQSKIALEQTTLRLNTVQNLGDMVATLAPAVSVIRDIRLGLVNFMPEAEHGMGEISNILSSTLLDAGRLGVPALNFEAANEDAQKILAEASIVAENKMKEKFPDLSLPIGEAT
jgi:division protein CdvB (Snf7/Vps24/ESCRT-III family)